MSFEMYGCEIMHSTFNRYDCFMLFQICSRSSHCPLCRFNNIMDNSRYGRRSRLGSLVQRFVSYHKLTTREMTSIMGSMLYYMPITDTTLELSVFWPSDTESRINELRFSKSISLSFKTRLTSVTCFCGDVTLSKLQAWNQRRKSC